jgi:cellulose synthase/poly-beta-1,6-N-acetylglucosamine synthase-like glycosyltransferase
MPDVSLLIIAHNEQQHIKDKLENSLLLQYPEDKLEIVVAADGCTDDTVGIVKSFANRGVGLIEIKEHLGKAHAINQAMHKIQNEIVVYSDANSIYEADAVKRLVQNFADPEIGVACGRLLYRNPTNEPMGEMEGLYARYDQWIRMQESEIHSTIGAIGAMYAIRRRLYSTIDPDVCDDFTIPLLIYRQGFRVIYEKSAKAYEDTSENTVQAFRRRVRTVLRELVALKKNWNGLKPITGFFGYQLISHKLLRWLVPFMLIGIFLGTWFLLDTTIGLILLCAQLIFYAAACVGLWMNRKGIISPVLRIPFYFCVANAAAFVAVTEFIRGKSIAHWQITRQG